MANREESIPTPESSNDILEGRVLRAQSGNYFVKLPGEDNPLKCSLRGRLKKDRQRITDLAAAGDCVQLVRVDEHTGVIEEILPRGSKLSRTLVRGTLTLEQVIAANIDQVVVVTSIQEPPFNHFMLDQFLVVAESAELDAVICLNKMDLMDEKSQAELMPKIEVYKEIGYQVILTSATTREGLEGLKEVIRDKISVFFGQSGVGKSCLLNAIQPGLKLRVSEVSAKTGLGTHTTSVAELLPLHMGGYVCDTPGIRRLRFWGIKKGELPFCFPEMQPLLQKCHYPNCSHGEEPGCAVRAAVEEGEFSKFRYKSYLRMRF